ALDAQVNDADARADVGRDHRGVQRLVDLALAQGADCLDRAQHDVDRLVAGERRADLVALTRARALRRTAGALALATTALAVLVELGERELLVDLTCASHGDS